MKTIDIIVTADGSTRVETRGFSGASCLDASRFLEQALGKAGADERTAEFHQTLESSTVEQRHTN
jgi:hypothetical protein